jgi:hypothetical protein
MNALKMYESVLRELDRFGSPRYDFDDQNYFVNKAKDAVVNDLVAQYEITQEVTEMLENIIVTDGIVFNVNDKSKVRKRPLKAGFDSLKSCKVTFRATVAFECFEKGHKWELPARRLTKDAEMFTMSNSFYRPSFTNENIYYQVRNKEIEILYDSLSHPEKDVVIDNVVVEHSVIVPDIIIGQNGSSVQDSVLHPKVNSKIVSMTALLFLENSKSQRTNTFSSLNIQTAPKLRIVNDSSRLELLRLKKKASGAFEAITVTGVAADDAAATDLLKIIGVADLHKGEVTRAIKTLGIAGRPQKSTITVTAPTVVAGKEFTIKLVTKTSNLEHEFVRFDGKNQKERYYNYILKAGDTPTTIAARIVQLITYDEFTDAYRFVSATSAAGVVTLTGLADGWDFTLSFEGEAVTDGNITLTHAVTEKSFEGRNVYRQLNVKRLETEARVYPYAAGHFNAPHELPVEGALYNSYQIFWTVTRTDLSGSSMHNQGPVTGEYGIELFIKNGGATAEEAILLAWLKANAKVLHEYNATTVAAAIVAESPTVTTN